MKQKKNSSTDSLSMIGLAANLGLSICLPIIGGALLGNFLDGKFATGSTITLSLILVGTFLGMSNMVFLLRESSKR